MTSKRAEFARQLRQSSGLSEEKVWALLRSGRIDAHKFRRQHPIDRYITDFACERLKLVIEIDGGIHARDDVAIKDHLRQTDLETMGWTVLRFTNEQVLTHPTALADAIRAHARLITL
ncbi:DUF559 domain-containing protein [Brevundimonas sp. BH3]|uniref:endonuclease domain-containing protein n=1 Tax=Brevundimonas sp. BH3 TaxID=3133089 RepID=UPI00324529B1